MKFFIMLTLVFFNLINLSADEYWLIQEDFIKMGKKEVYETQKLLQLKEKKQQVFGVADLENPQFLFLLPLKNLASLTEYTPFSEQTKNLTLEACINFQIFSLHQLIEKSSLRPKETFVETRPYYSYVIYETQLEDGPFLEEMFAKSISSAKKEDSWCLWKSLIAGDGPKYIFCASFSTKEQMKEWKVENVIEESKIKNRLRDKKSGWMKRQDSFCLP